MKTPFAANPVCHLLAAALAIAATPARAEPAPPPSAAIPSRQAGQEQTALKIAGLVTFVANSCPRLRPDYTRFKAFIRLLGVSEAQLATPDFKNRYLSYTAAYGADAATSCKRAQAQFGPGGSTLPDLFVVQ